MERVCVEHVTTMTSYKDLSVGDLSKWPIPGQSQRSCCATVQTGPLFASQRCEWYGSSACYEWCYSVDTPSWHGNLLGQLNLKVQHCATPEFPNPVSNLMTLKVFPAKTSIWRKRLGAQEAWGLKFLKPKPKVLWFKLSGPATHAKDIGLGIGAKYDKGIYTRVNGASSESHGFCRMFELQLYNGSLPNEATCVVQLDWLICFVSMHVSL